ncbi:MAG: hypothetical protein GY928_28980, partial [Colwellia sp.]|nr:hypothetical protein [Colwellia sp.]
MATNQDITVKLTLDDKGYIKGIKGSTKETEKFGKKGKDTFGGLGSSAVKMAGQVGGVYLAFKAVGKIVGEVAEGVKLYNVQARAETKLAAVLKATGNAAGYTSDELIRMAGSLQNVTNFGDEAIINAQSMLATFTKIGHEAFPEATKAVLDLSEVMDQDLKTSAVQIGKALNDPILGVTALGRTGIQFSQDQKAMIKSLVKSNDMLGAQKIILGELENQFGGVAQELSTTFEGTAESIGNIVGDIQEGLGSGFVDNTVDPMKELLENLKQTAPALNEVAKSLGNIAGSIASVPLNALNGWIDLFEAHTAGSSAAISNTLVKDMAMAQDKLTAGIKSNISPLMQEDVFKNFGGAGGISGLFAKGGRGDLGALRTISTNKELQAVFDSLQSEVKGYNEALKKHKESIDKKTVEIKEETDKTVLSVGKETASTTFNGTADVDTNPLFKSLDPNAGLYGQLGTLGGVSQEELAIMEENWGKINQTVELAIDEQTKQSLEMDKEHNQRMLD